jgi:hypothetical protein
MNPATFNKPKAGDIPVELRHVLIAGRNDPVLFAEKLLGMPLHDGQKKYLRESIARKAKINILVPSNRWGKSSMAAVLQIHNHFYKLGIPSGNREAWMKAEYRTANVAPAAVLVEPIFKYIDQILTSMYPIQQPDGSIVTNKCLIEWFYLKHKTTTSPPFKQFFAFNSYIEHRTLGMTGADSLEGKPFGLITYDEGGRSNHLEEEVNGTLLARLFDWNGQLHIISTPQQESASILYHYKLYQDGLVGLNNVYTMEGELKDNTFFPPEQIEAQYELYKDNPLYEQVIHGKFVFGGDNLFDSLSILNAQDESLNDGIPLEHGHYYVFGTDSAIGADEMVYTCLDTTTKPFRLVNKIHAKGNSKSPQRHLNDLVMLVDSYKENERGNVKHMLETWNGESVRFYHDLPEWLKAITKCYGSFQPQLRKTDNQNVAKSQNNDAKKADLLMSLRKLLSAGELKIPANDTKLIQQLSIYREDDKNIPTDHVFSLALACWLATEGSDFLKTEIVFYDM